MSAAAALVTRLAEAGTPPDLLAAVAGELFAAEAERQILERRRRGERERKARSRDQTGRDVTGRDGTGSDVTGPSPDKSPPDPQKLTPNPCVRTARARLGHHRLPEGWTPTRPLPPSTRAKADQWPPGALDEELAALHRWAANASDAAGRGRKRDWDKAWVNWIERRHDEHFRRTGPAAARAAWHQAGDGLSATTRAALRIFGPTGAGAEGSVPQ